MLGFLKRSKVRVSITNINLKIMGGVHSIGPKEVRERVFSVNVPFTNKSGSDLVPAHFKRPSIRIDRVSITAPFTLVSLAPQLPVEIAYREQVVFKFRIKAPEEQYMGPVTIDFGNNPQDIIHLTVNKITLKSEKRDVDLQDSAFATSVQKNQIFKKDVQLYKALAYGDKVQGVAVNQPFELVGTEPRLPLTVDQQRSYPLTLYLKAPDFSYAGPLEVTLK